MNFYEHTLIAKQDLSTPELNSIEKKYNDIITKTDGKIRVIFDQNCINKLQQ